MTGGILPRGFDTIIPIEQIIFYPKKNPKFIFVNKKIKKHQHVRIKGSDFKRNDLLVKKRNNITIKSYFSFKNIRYFES